MSQFDDGDLAAHEWRRRVEKAWDAFVSTEHHLDQAWSAGLVSLRTGAGGGAGAARTRPLDLDGWPDGDIEFAEVLRLRRALGALPAPDVSDAAWRYGLDAVRRAADTPSASVDPTGESAPPAVGDVDEDTLVDPDRPVRRRWWPTGGIGLLAAAAAVIAVIAVASRPPGSEDASVSFGGSAAASTGAFPPRTSPTPSEITTPGAITTPATDSTARRSEPSARPADSGPSRSATPPQTEPGTLGTVETAGSAPQPIDLPTVTVSEPELVDPCASTGLATGTCYSVRISWTSQDATVLYFLEPDAATLRDGSTSLPAQSLVPHDGDQYAVEFTVRPGARACVTVRGARLTASIVSELTCVTAPDADGAPAASGAGA
jgi:hypothetical protein